MHLIYRQVVIQTLVSDEVLEKSEIKAVLTFFKKKCMGLSITIKKFGSTHRHDLVRILKIHDNNTCDFVSADSGHTLTIRGIHFDNIMEISATSRVPVDQQELENIDIMDDIFNFDSEDANEQEVIDDL